MKNLFMTGDFTLHSGKKSRWKIECDALTFEDWQGIAAIAADYLPKFREAFGVPKGGEPFALALNKYATGEGTFVLIVDDVLTTGDSMERYCDELKTDHVIPPGTTVMGLVLFARGECPVWVRALFQMPLPSIRTPPQIIQQIEREFDS